MAYDTCQHGSADDEIVAMIGQDSCGDLSVFNVPPFEVPIRGLTKSRISKLAAATFAVKSDKEMMQAFKLIILSKMSASQKKKNYRPHSTWKFNP